MAETIGLPTLAVEEVAGLFDRATMGALLRRPALWATAAAALAALAPRGWWRRPPFLPIPDRALLDWRLSTAYGSADTTPSRDDVVAYLEWRRGLRR